MHISDKEQMHCIYVDIERNWKKAERMHQDRLKKDAFPERAIRMLFTRTIFICTMKKGAGEHTSHEGICVTCTWIQKAVKGNLRGCT